MIEATDVAWFCIGALSSITYILWDMGRALKRLSNTIAEELE